MKRRFISPVLAFSGLILGGCGGPTASIKARNVGAPVSRTGSIPKATPVFAPVPTLTPTPTLPPIVVQSGKSSLPAERQMLGDRPSGQPLPTATKGIDFSKDVPISNEPKSPPPLLKPRNNGLDFTKGVVISNAPNQRNRPANRP